MSEIASGSSASDQPPLSVVIPAHNEAHRIERAIEGIRKDATARGWHPELIVVDDGSTDTTAEVARRCGSADGRLPLRVLSNPKRTGKASAVRRGVLEANGQLILLCDADMSTPMSEFDKLLPWIHKGHQVVIASRDMPKTVLRPAQPWQRRLMGMLFRSVRQQMLLPDLRDTQCGFKLFTHHAAHLLFGRLKETTLAFDCEILAMARREGFRIKEVGVLWCDDPDSRIRPWRDGVAMLLALWRIRRRLR